MNCHRLPEHGVGFALEVGVAVTRLALAPSVPLSSPLQNYLERLHVELSGLRSGEVASYIPELAQVDADAFGLCLGTVDGALYEVGDTRTPFTIQSISKPFVFGLALEDRGRERVAETVSVEPSGEAFNSIRLEPETGRPLNPMVNAGAIATASLIAGESPEDRFERVRSLFSLSAGRSLDLDEAVYRSEKETGHRNRAIGHLLRNFGVLREDPEAALDLYFRQCSLRIDCRDLAWMGATLANSGVHPRTGERALSAHIIGSVLSVMTTCGMYDGSGLWAYSVGLPAKSGVGGGVLAILPGQLSVAVFSPRLDPHGNSTRGVAVCDRLSKDFQLHFLRPPRPAQTLVRASYSLAEVGSKRRRSAPERQRLEIAGRRVRTYEVQGDIGFGALERLIRTVTVAAVSLDAVILDLRRTSSFEPALFPLFIDFVRTVTQDDRRLVLVTGRPQARLLRRVEEDLSPRPEWSRLARFLDLDAALEWCENAILAAGGTPVAMAEEVLLRQHEVLRGLNDVEFEQVETIATIRDYNPGERIICRGNPAEFFCLLLAGRVSVTLDLPDGAIRRLATLSAGTVFGELAIVEREARTADVRADTPVRCALLRVDAIDRLGVTHPAIKIRLLENLLRGAAGIVRRLNREVVELSSVQFP